MKTRRRKENGSFEILYRGKKIIIDKVDTEDLTFYKTNLDVRDPLVISMDLDKHNHPAWISCNDNRHDLAEEIGLLIEKHDHGI
jgi:hypothetical protein